MRESLRSCQGANALARHFRLGLRAVALLLFMLLPSARAADLEVEIRGVKPQGGDLHAALFDNAEDFSLDLEVRAMISGSGEISTGVFTREEDFPRPPAQRVSVSADGKVVRIRFTDLKPGEYAVAMFQDRNGNGRLDTNFAKTPLEPWGMSNDARPPNRAPTFDDAKFAVPAEGAVIIVNLR
jgi:uncharacterized protein (DUF2141 family)